MEGGVLREVDESGSTKGEDIVEEAIISFLLLAAFVLPLEVLCMDVNVGIEDDEVFVFLLDPAPIPAVLFCHNKALNGLPAALAPLLSAPP